MKERLCQLPQKGYLFNILCIFCLSKMFEKIFLKSLKQSETQSECWRSKLQFFFNQSCFKIGNDIAGVLLFMGTESMIDY